MAKDKRIGLKPKDRQLVVEKPDKQLTANQWRNSPQQNKFMAAWLDPSSPTFGNAYRSALSAGYSNNYALQVASVGNQWITDYHKRSNVQLEHLEEKLFSMITTTPNSKSPDDTVVKAIELLARLTGKLDNKNGSTTNILVQPILNGSSVTRQTIDTTPTKVHDVVEAELIPD